MVLTHQDPQGCGLGLCHLSPLDQQRSRWERGHSRVGRRGVRPWICVVSSPRIRDELVLEKQLPGVENGWRCCEVPPTCPLQTAGAAGPSAAGSGRPQPSSAIGSDRAGPTLAATTAMADGTKASLLASIWGHSEGSSQPQNVLRGQQGHLPSCPLSGLPPPVPPGVSQGSPSTPVSTCLQLRVSFQCRVRAHRFKSGL